MDSREEDTQGEVRLLFGWFDCFLFGLMLALSTMIGIYFGFCGKSQDSPKEYLNGGKTMSILPVAVSLVASTLSGITVMGVPSEIYTYGTLYWAISICGPIVGLINNYIYLPVFYELQLTSVYEYLERRFDQKVRIMASMLCTIALLLYVPIVVYVPALAFSQVSGWNIHYITPVISAICIFYTMLGGIKAVVWTDFLQGMVMVAASIAVIILGIIHVGGFTTVWERNDEGGRIKFFEMNPSVFERMSLWSVLIGGVSGWVGGIAVNQVMVQRFLSLSTYGKAQKSLIYFVIGIILIKAITCFIGLLIFATYHDCDPIKSKAISRTDQLLSYYVMDIASAVPGLPGLFVAGIFSAALSTMSSSLNSLGATLFEDFIRPCVKSKLSDKCASNIIKSVVVVVGCICVAMVFIVDKLGSVLQLAMSTSGVTSGAMLGLFTFGMAYPRGNAKGALAGSLSCLVIMGWIVFGSQLVIAEGTFKYKTLATSSHGCLNITVTETITEEVSEEAAFVLFRITFMYYTLMGVIIVFVVGITVSLLTEKPNLQEIDPVLFTPLVRKYVLRMREQSNDHLQSVDLPSSN